ncbi:hypothetical protein BDZ89DRAFT_1141485 [Hymenopellis radicata]|nr:hypothetical protein BDZ89DRAFT_1141485 [Hymenopellis radicata]
MRFAATALLAFVSSAMASPLASRADYTITLSGDADHLYRLHFTWEGGYPPYTVGIYKSDGGLYLQRVQSELSVTWNVDAAGGKQVNLQLYDTNGTNAGTANIPVVNGTDVSCVKCAGYAGYQFC